MAGAHAGPVLRWARALALAAVTWATGAAGHLAAGGALPDPAALAALALTLALTTLAVAPLLGRELRAGAVVGLLVAGQAGIHVALGALTAPAAGGSGVGSGGTTSHGAHAQAAGHAVAGDPSWLHHLVGDLAGPGALMGLAHLGAAVLVGGWLAVGERALWALLRVAGRPVVELARALQALGTWLPPVGRSPRSTSRGAADARPPALLLVLVDSIARRGPPQPVG